MSMLENSMVIGPYYPDPPKPEPDEDAAYEKLRDRLEQSEEEADRADSR
jgi:hypothetical protein